MASNFLMGDVNYLYQTIAILKQMKPRKIVMLWLEMQLLKKLFDDLLYSTRKEERCAGTEAFSHLLGEQNELTQELASQGMSIVYELGDASMKENWVHALVNSLTGSGKRKRAIKLVEDSECFKRELLVKVLVEGNSARIRSFANVANEMGQPDLIYKFMDLANYQASLIPRGIAKQAGDALKPHLRSLIPRLVRYQYDPDKKCAGCKHLRKLWSAAFRAMDDIKETVRNSGDKLCRALTSLTVRLSDVSLTGVSEARQTMDIVKNNYVPNKEYYPLPLDCIRPHLSDLVCCMLESLSSLEDQGLNYVELHAANVGIQTEKLENLRISIAKGSPMWETLDLCIKVVDSEALDQLVPRLAQLVRSGVGLNTRVGIASFITLLVQKVGVEIKPYTSRLLRLLFPVVKDEKSAASNVPSPVLVQLNGGSHESRNLDRESRNWNWNWINYSTLADPIIDCDDSRMTSLFSGLFEELWEEHTSSERVALQLYLEEIVSLICEGIGSSSWASKKKSAQAISKLSEGKDALLYAIAALSVSCNKAISSDDPATMNEILSVVSSACTKKQRNTVKQLSLVLNRTRRETGKIFRGRMKCCNPYRLHCQRILDSFLLVVKAFGNQEFFNVVFPLLYEMFTSGTLSQSGEATLVVDAAKAACIHVAHINDILGQQKNLMHVLIATMSSGLPWTVKISALSSAKELCSRLQKVLDDSQESPANANIISLVQELFLSMPPQ
ncbi:unnamed protein product [Prunus armeniaca]|uniref:Proteasome adapter and scaffold protein ECM29 HEAT-repeat domain-containing protein n=1 Tax=Prunus armeniaca TaxID=36596 RepID=A0A6J5XDJ4_PRUAR|nr:unnamed protein product [Prunus armeniaca]